MQNFHSRTDAGSGYVHTKTATAANVRPSSIKVPVSYQGINWDISIRQRYIGLPYIWDIITYKKEELLLIEQT